VLNDQQFAQFFNTDEAQVTPSVGLFQKWMALTNKKQQLDIFAAYGWAEAQLFTQALKAAGPKATRASILTALRQIKKFDADGLFATANPADHVPATCWLENTIKGGKFVRVDPAKGFRCDGTYFRRAG